MGDTAIDVSGEMEHVPKVDTKSQLFNYLQLPTQLPDPKEWLKDRRNHVRPWLLFVQTSNFKMPPSIPRLSRRVLRNIEYFHSNYLFISVGLIIYCLITSPLLLMAICGSLYCGYKLSVRHKEKKLVIYGQELTLAQQYVLVGFCSMPIFYLVGAGSALFWVLGASVFVVSLHAACYNIDAIGVEDEGSFPLIMEEV